MRMMRHDVTDHLNDESLSTFDAIIEKLGGVSEEEKGVLFGLHCFDMVKLEDNADDIWDKINNLIQANKEEKNETV